MYGVVPSGLASELRRTEYFSTDIDRLTIQTLTDKEFIHKAMKQLSIERLSRYLSQRAPIRELFTEYSFPTSYEEQLQLVPHLETIANHNGYYLRMFLKKYLEQVELHAGGDIDDSLYDIMASVIAAKELDPTEYDYLTYPIVSNEMIRMRENPRIISGANTTGFRTWEAAICLSLILKSDSVWNTYSDSSVTVVELGSGTGLVSLLLLQRHKKSPFLKDIYITDGSVELVENFKSTLTLNGFDPHDKNLHLQQLLWGDNIENSTATYRNTDVLVGADITYDSSVLPCLIEELKYFFTNSIQQYPQAIIGATVRNEETIVAWEYHLNENFAGKWSVSRPDLNDDEFLGDIYIKNKTWPINIYFIG